MELSLHDAEFSSLDPSFLAASALCLSFKLLNGTGWVSDTHTFECFFFKLWFAGAFHSECALWLCRRERWSTTARTSRRVCTRACRRLPSWCCAPWSPTTSTRLWSASTAHPSRCASAWFPSFKANWSESSPTTRCKSTKYMVAQAQVHYTHTHLKTTTKIDEKLNSTQFKRLGGILLFLLLFFSFLVCLLVCLLIVIHCAFKLSLFFVCLFVLLSCSFLCISIRLSIYTSLLNNNNSNNNWNLTFQNSKRISLPLRLLHCTRHTTFAFQNCYIYTYTYNNNVTFYPTHLNCQFKCSS